MAVHLPRAMFVGFLSFGHYGYLLSFIQHLAAASFALENLHSCGTYEYVVFALTVWLFVRFLLISAAASFILSKKTVLVCQIEQCQRLQSETEYFACCCVFPAGVGIVVIADVDAHVSLHSHLHFQQLSIVKNAPRRCLRCVELQFTYWHEECDMNCCYICLHYDKLIFPTSFCSSSSLSMPKYIFVCVAVSCV